MLPHLHLHPHIAPFICFLLHLPIAILYASSSTSTLYLLITSCPLLVPVPLKLVIFNYTQYNYIMTVHIEQSEILYQLELMVLYTRALHAVEDLASAIYRTDSLTGSLVTGPLARSAADYCRKIEFHRGLAQRATNSN